MNDDVDPALVSLFGSRTRLLTIAVLANAGQPLTGYRVATVAGLPREKVYPELRKAVATGLIAKTAKGYTLTDPEVRSLLSKRVRISWDKDWFETREKSPEKIPGQLADMLASLPTDPEFFRPKNWKPTPSALRAIKEMTRSPEKDAVLRSMGLRTSYREWARGF